MDTIADKTKYVVLIVDDDPVCRLFCVQSLRACGYQTYTASDGDGAIRMALRKRPQVVLTDLHLPDMSGAEAISRLRNLWPDAGTCPRFIALSGDESNDARTAMRLARFDIALTKPFSVEKLLACVEKTETRAEGGSKSAARSHELAKLRSAENRPQASAVDLRTYFRTELNEQLIELDRLITALDWKRAADTVHRLSGAAALAGFSGFAGKSRLLLQKLSDPQDVASMAQTYLDFLRQAAELFGDPPLQARSGLRHCE